MTVSAEQVKSPVLPTLDQRLRDVDLRLKDQAMREKRALAVAYIDPARRRFEVAVAESSDPEVRSTYAELRRLESMAGDAPRTVPTAIERVPRGPRADHREIVNIAYDYIRSHPGCPKSAIIEATGGVDDGILFTSPAGQADTHHGVDSEQAVLGARGLTMRGVAMSLWNPANWVLGCLVVLLILWDDWRHPAETGKHL